MIVDDGRGWLLMVENDCWWWKVTDTRMQMSLYEPFEWGLNLVFLVHAPHPSPQGAGR